MGMGQKLTSHRGEILLLMKILSVVEVEIVNAMAHKNTMHIFRLKGVKSILALSYLQIMT